MLSRDAAGTDDTCVYDARDRKTVCTDRVGAVTTYAYDPNSNLASITDGEGGLTSYTYDARNLQTLTIYPNDGSQPGGLDPIGGDRVTMAYDGLRRPSSKLDQAGIVTTFAYDLAGRMTERSYDGNGTAVQRLALSLPLDAPGGVDPYHGVPREHTAAFGAPAGGKALVVTSDDAKVNNNYGGISIPLGNADVVAGKRYRLSYWARAIDSPGPIHFSHQSGSGGSTQLTHDRNLTTTWQKYEREVDLTATRTRLYVWVPGYTNNAQWRFALDGLTIEEVTADGVPVQDADTITYDLASRPTAATKGRYGNTVSFAYDAEGRLSGETLTLAPGTPGNAGSQDRSFTLTRGYDADDQLTQIVYPNGGGTVQRTHTARHQLANVSHEGVALASFTYDPGMRETRRDLGNGLARTSGYDRSDNLVTSHEVAGRPELSLDYAYADPNKNLTSETRGGVMAPSSFTAGHDSGDRLINWDRTSGELRAWNLSLVGDWDQYNGTTAAGGAFAQTRTHNPVHEILGVTSDSTEPGVAGGEVKHDAKGNIVEEGRRGSDSQVQLRRGQHAGDRQRARWGGGGGELYLRRDGPAGDQDDLRRHHRLRERHRRLGDGAGDPGVRRRLLHAKPAVHLRQLRG